MGIQLDNKRHRILVYKNGEQVVVTDNNICNISLKIHDTKLVDEVEFTATKDELEAITEKTRTNELDIDTISTIVMDKNTENQQQTIDEDK